MNVNNKLIAFEFDNVERMRWTNMFYYNWFL